MTKILLLTPQLPYPPEQGTSLRNYNIVRGLLQRYVVTLLSFADVSPTAEILDQLAGCDDVLTVPTPHRSTATRLLRMVSDRRPDIAHRLQSDAFVEALTKLLQQGGGRTDSSHLPFDIVQVEGIEMAFAISAIRALSPGAKILFDDHNAEYELQRRSYLADRADPRRLPAAAYSRVQVSRLERYERWVCEAVDHVVAVSNEDRRFLRELGVTKPLSVIPNSIDVRDYAAVERQTADIDLIFVGKMDYRPNVDAVLWFANEIWPLILQSRPKTTWAIVGQKPHSRLEPISDRPGITVTGRVEKVQPFLHRSRICIMPFRVGGGTRLKLIEAMASGLAVVSTRVGAEGFEVQSGEELLLADEPAEFAASVLALLEDQSRRSLLGENARLFADQYDWRRVSPRFVQVYEDLLASEEPADC